MRAGVRENQRCTSPEFPNLELLLKLLFVDFKLNLPEL
jgi:hypothetical protein